MLKLEKLVPVGTTFAGALLFAMGYSYLNSFYGYFGIALTEIAPSVQDIVAYSVVVLMSAIPYLLGILMLIYFFVFVAYRAIMLDKTPQLAEPAYTFLLVSAALAACASGISLSQSLGERLAEESAALAMRNSIWVDGDDSAEKLLERIKSAKIRGQVHFLYATKESLFLLVSYNKAKSFSIVRIGRKPDMKFGVMLE